MVKFFLTYLRLSLSFPIKLIKSKDLQNDDKCPAIAAAPPKYCSFLFSLITKCGSLPDFPRTSPNMYSSMMVSPTNNILRSLKLLIFL